jgi:hypothetical protein
VVGDARAEYGLHDLDGGTVRRLAERAVRGGEGLIADLRHAVGELERGRRLQGAPVDRLDAQAAEQHELGAAVGVAQAAAHERVAAEGQVADVDAEVEAGLQRPRDLDRPRAAVLGGAVDRHRSGLDGDADGVRVGGAGEDQVDRRGDDVAVAQRGEELGGGGSHQTSSGGQGTMSDGALPAQS